MTCNKLIEAGSPPRKQLTTLRQTAPVLRQPCSDGASTNATAYIPDLDMAVDEIDESEDGKIEVWADEEDDDE